MVSMHLANLERLGRDLGNEVKRSAIHVWWFTRIRRGAPRRWPAHDILMMLGHATRSPKAADPSPRIASCRVSIALAVLLLCGTPAFSEEAPPPPAKPELTELSLA